MKTQHLFITVMLSVTITLACSFAYWYYLLRPPVLVTFDLKGTVNAFIRQSAKLDLDDKQRHQLLIRFERNMKTVTNEYAQQHRVSILVSAAAVSGMPDITQDIQTRLATAMQGPDTPPQDAK